MVVVSKPHVRISNVISDGASFVQRLEEKLITDATLRDLAHFALAAANCSPIDMTHAEVVPLAVTEERSL